MCVSQVRLCCCCCCCCCRHIKRPSESAQSSGCASDADVFRGHRLTALMWGEEGNDKNQNRTRIRSHRIPFSERGLHFLRTGRYTCPVNRGTCKALPHNPANSQLNLRNSVAFSTKNTQHGIVVRKMFFVHARPRTQVFLTYTPSPPRVPRVRLSCIAESTAEIRMVFA